MSAPALETYRTIGPFDADSLPGGLLAEHRLKPGAWALLKVVAGEIGLVWDDEGSDSQVLMAGKSVLIPPQRPHHLEPRGAFVLVIEFRRQV